MSFLACLLAFQLVISSRAWSYHGQNHMADTSQFATGSDGLAMESDVSDEYGYVDLGWLPGSARSWAQYSPWYAVREYVPPPEGCVVTQVNILQRHGARFPTSGASERIVSALEKLQSAETYTDSSLDFLQSYKYDLGTDDQVRLGAAQSFESGMTVYQRYAGLVNESNLPFVRASGSTRVIDSAMNWTAGFAKASGYTYSPKLSVILDESLNDTLDDAMCPNAGTSDTQTDIWLSIYAPPITARLNAGAPGANLTDTDTYNLMSLCPFESVAKEEVSEFCELFSDEAFEAFEYRGDLDKYYNTGYGQDLGPVQGVGYINELLARLTRTPVRDHTQTNRTLDSSPATFPLDRGIYADFSHDNQMVAIYAAMGLFREARALDPWAVDEGRGWVVSGMVPFSGRMVVERVGCADGGLGEGEWVRVLVNEEVQPLEFCADGGVVGMCRLDAFVESQGYARRDGDGDFERCFE